MIMKMQMSLLNQDMDKDVVFSIEVFMTFYLCMFRYKNKSSGPGLRKSDNLSV